MAKEQEQNVQKKHEIIDTEFARWHLANFKTMKLK